MWTTLNFKGFQKQKNGLEIFERYIEFERDWSVGLGATLGHGQKIKNYFFQFEGNTDSVILLGFECTIKPQNLIKIVRAIFEKFDILIFFSHVNYP